MFLNIQSKKLTIFSLIVIFLTSCGGGGGNTSTSSAYSGVAQKGPFEVGTDIVISQLDSSGIPTGKSIKSKVEDSSGRFTYNLPDDWNIGVGDAAINIRVEGFFFDESSGTKSNSKISLNSITNNPDLSSVNLLTDWTYKRYKELQQKGQSLKSAIEQSEKEILSIFGIDNIHQLNIAQLESFASDNAMLLLLSGALMEMAEQSRVDPQQISNEIALDFSDDGKLTELGDDWFVRMQMNISENPKAHINSYARELKLKEGLESPIGDNLPEAILLASRPSAILPTELIVKPGEIVILDGSESHDNPIENEGLLINYTWFRVDQQIYKTPFSDRFSQTPSITAPDEETELLFALVVTDELKLTDTAVMKVIVKNQITPNNPPIAVNDTKSTKEDTQVILGVDDIVATNDTDADGDPLSIILVSESVNGVAVLLSTGMVSFIPAPNFVGNASFKYTISDGHGGMDTAIVTIIVTAVNDAPVALNYTCTLDNSAPINSIDLSGFQFTDAEGDNITQYFINNPPLSITPILLLEDNDNPPPLFIHDGKLTAEPSGNTATSTSFEYTVRDENGSESAPATVKVIYSPSIYID